MSCGKEEGGRSVITGLITACLRRSWGFWVAWEKKKVLGFFFSFIIVFYFIFFNIIFYENNIARQCKCGSLAT